jgi:hypothetical protein
MYGDNKNLMAIVLKVVGGIEIMREGLEPFFSRLSLKKKFPISGLTWRGDASSRFPTVAMGNPGLR